MPLFSDRRTKQNHPDGVNRRLEDKPDEYEGLGMGKCQVAASEWQVNSIPVEIYHGGTEIFEGVDSF
jgi:hypothetical protein